MPSSERPIVFTNDLDGVHFLAPPPLKTMMRLFRGHLSLPEIGKALGEYSPGKGFIATVSSRWSVFFHQIRPINPEALAGLARFKQIAEDHQRQLSFAALSGREQDKHTLTRARLKLGGHMAYFTQTYLNEGQSAISWKESVVRGLVSEGNNVVHIDDDLRPGLCIARVDRGESQDPRVLVYVLNNLSNHPRLLRRAGIEIPPNLVIIPNFTQAANNFDRQLTQGNI